MALQREKKPKSILNIDGTEYKTIVPEDYFKRHGWQMKDETLICSFIPGTISKIYVKVGQKVKKGEKLLTLEAMKMKNRVLAPRAGKILSLQVKVGENVKKEQPLFKMDFESK